MVVGGLYHTIAEISFCRADKRTVSASAPLPLVSATVEAGASTFQSKSGSEKRSRDRKEVGGGKKEDGFPNRSADWLGMTVLCRT